MVRMNQWTGGVVLEQESLCSKSGVFPQKLILRVI